MKKFVLFSFILCLMLASLPAGAATAFMDEIDSGVDTIFRKAKTVGGSVVVMKDGQFVYARDYGMRNLHRKLPVDENTYFKMGCVTKMAASLAMFQLIEDGTLDLDADISQVFGYEIANPHFPKTPITLRQLLSHTSSVNETGGYSNLHSTVQGMLSKASNRPTNYRKVAPGSEYRYSNFGSGLVGSMVEQVSGQSVNRFVVERLFEPLGMDAALSASWLKSPEDIANVYKDGRLKRAASRYISEEYEDFASPETHYRTMVGSLFIRSRDLAKLAVALCGDGSVDGVRLLSPDMVQLMRKPQHTLGKSVTGESPYGLFLERNTRVLPGHTIYGHQGMLGGASNNVFFEPETGFVLVVTNNGSSQSRDHGIIILAQNMLRYTYPLFAGTQK